MDQEELDEMDDEEVLEEMINRLREAESLTEELGDRTAENADMVQWGVLASIDSALEQINMDLRDEDMEQLIS